MRLMTKHLGEIEYEQEAVISFDEGLPGFENVRSFVLILSEDAELPFHYLQSVDNPSIAFVVTSPFLFVGDYDFDLK